MLNVTLHRWLRISFSFKFNNGYIFVQSSFPREIIFAIFNYLTDEDKKTCLTVCKLCSIVSSNLLGALQVKIQPPITCHDLFQDIVRYKTFGPKVSCITVDNREIPKDELSLQYIINACPNLIHLRFMCEFRLYGYLSKLNKSDTMMPNVRRVHVMNRKKATRR